MAELQQSRDTNNIGQTSVAIIGGGIAGATVALCLSELGMHVDLLEKGPSLVNGPPICHLHAGGNLYREISEQQCLTLLIQSVDLLRLYPYAADYRPTVIAIPKDDPGSPEALLPRLNSKREGTESLDLKERPNLVNGRSIHGRARSRPPPATNLRDVVCSHSPRPVDTAFSESRS